MKRLTAYLAVPGLFLATIAACGVVGSNPEPAPAPLAVTSQPLTAAGSIPAGLPQRVLVGLKEGHLDSWMTNSGVAWDARYRYFTKGWVNNWNSTGPKDGNWGLDYMKQCDTQGYIPFVQYYQIVDETVNDQYAKDETKTLLKVQNIDTMKGYFGDFKILMQKAKEFGKPVVILLEADGFAYLEKQSNDNPNTYAAVAATGMPELSGLPDTVAGWGLAFLQLRKSVQANNVILGIHVSAWASGTAISYVSPTVPLQPEVDKVYNFLAPLGLTSNVTGETYDLLVGDPLDRDSGYYKVVKNEERWWEACDNASTRSASFNRYAEWLRLWNVKTSRRWVLWQIPQGNSNHLNVYNDGGVSHGYKDNRPEYFFGNDTARTAHVARFAKSGVIALLFGAGADGQSTHVNDYYTDGQLFMKSRVASYYQAGGVPLDGGYSGPVTVGNCPFTHFEQDTEGWAPNSTTSAGFISSITTSTAQAYEGSRSLAITFNGTQSGTASVVRTYPWTPEPPANTVVTFRIWIPTGSPIAWVQPFVQQSDTGQAFTGNYKTISNLTAGAWNTLSVTVPADAVQPLWKIGVQVNMSSPWTGTVYVDSVNW